MQQVGGLLAPQGLSGEKFVHPLERPATSSSAAGRHPAAAALALGRPGRVQLTKEHVVELEIVLCNIAEDELASGLDAQNGGIFRLTGYWCCCWCGGAS